ncbi:MAG: peptidylprolyl isomerase [Caulobacteraceae bacterium]
MSRVRGVKWIAATMVAACPLVWAGMAGPAAAQQDVAQVATAAPSQPPPRPALSGGVAALVNDDVISTYDLRQRTLFYIVTAGVQPTRDNLPQIQQAALQSLVDERIELQELRKLEKEQKFSIIADDQEVKEALEDFAKQNNSTLDEMRHEFARVGLGLDTMREQIRAQISWNRMIQGRYGTRVRIGDNQVNMAMQRVKASASQPQYHVSEIFLDSGRAGGMTEAMNGARQLIAQIKQGAPFGPVARQFSSAPTAAANGDMGWVSKGEMQPELAATVEQMKPGQISDPIQVSDGVYILQLQDERTGVGATTVDLKQAAVRLAADAPPAQVETARQTLEKFRATGATCANLESQAANYGDIVAGDLGQSEIGDLAPDFRQVADSLPLNQFSDPIRTPVGLHLIMVCSREQGQAQLPSKQDIENRLAREEMSMLAKRYLRDLRNSATIETP